jgi:hypothetical protein
MDERVGMKSWNEELECADSSDCFQDGEP